MMFVVVVMMMMMMSMSKHAQANRKYCYRLHGSSPQGGARFLSAQLEREVVSAVGRAESGRWNEEVPVSIFNTVVLF